MRLWFCLVTQPIGEHTGHCSSVLGEGNKLRIFLLETELTGVGTGLTDVRAGWEKAEGGVGHTRQPSPPQSLRLLTLATRGDMAEASICPLHCKEGTLESLISFPVCSLSSPLAPS